MTNVKVRSVQELHLQKIKFSKWQAIANCNWYPKYMGIPVNMYPPQAEKQREAALNICSGCPTQRQCLELALTSREENGVWGGTTEAERKEIIERIGEEYVDLHKNLWTDQLGETIKRFADLTVEAFNRENDIDETGIEELIAERRAFLARLEED